MLQAAAPKVGLPSEVHLREATKSGGLSSEQQETLRIGKEFEMAYASPGTDTSTDLDIDEKNQMVLTVLNILYFFEQCIEYSVDGQCFTNLDVIFFKKNS